MKNNVYDMSGEKLDMVKLMETVDLMQEVISRRVEIIRYINDNMDRITNILNPSIPPKTYTTFHTDFANPYEYPMYDIHIMPDMYIVYALNVCLKAFIVVNKFEASNNSLELNAKYWLLICILDIIISSDYKRITFDNDVKNIREKRNESMLSALRNKAIYPEGLEPLTDNDLKYLKNEWYETSNEFYEDTYKIKNSKDIIIPTLKPIIDNDEELFYLYDNYDNAENIQITFIYDTDRFSIINLKSQNTMCSIKTFLSNWFTNYSLFVSLCKLGARDMLYKPKTEFSINSDPNNIKITIKLYYKSIIGKYQDDSTGELL